MSSTKWKAFKIRHEKAIKIVSVLLIIFVLISVVFFATALTVGYIGYREYQQNLVTFVVTPELCVDLTRSLPAKINTEWRDYFASWDMNYNYEDGNLNLTIHKQRLASLVAANQEYIDAAIQKGVKISPDYTRVEFDAYDPIDRNQLVSPWSILQCAWLQLYNGVPAEDIKVEVVAMDYETGEAVYQATWPELIEYTYVTNEFTVTFKLNNGIASYDKESVWK